MALPFFTIGHSNRSTAEFVALLQQVGIERLADVRTVPKSRANPQFNTENLAVDLAAVQIVYEHIPALGGLRGKARTVAPEVNGLWSNQSFHNYADYAVSAVFQAGLEQLIAKGHRQQTAVMCSEAVWWRCHRRIIADYLIARGEEVIHIMGEGRLEPARLTAGAVVLPDGIVVYPAPDP